MTRHKVVTVTSSAQNLATALGLSGTAGPTSTRVGHLSVQALGGNAGIIYLGGTEDTLTAASAYGIRLEIPVSTVPSAPFFRESMTPSSGSWLDLSEYQFIGTDNDKMSVLWEPMTK